MAEYIDKSEVNGLVQIGWSGDAIVTAIINNAISSFPAIPIPKGATIGDMISAMFPNCEVSIHEYMGIKCGVDVKIYFSENESFTAWFPSCLWNAPYKKEVEE